MGNALFMVVILEVVWILSKSTPFGIWDIQNQYIGTYYHLLS